METSIFTPAIDVEDLLRIARSGSAKSIKRRWIKAGYDKQMSLYGVITDEGTEESNYCRIEILSNVSYNERIVATLYDFFKWFMLTSSYSIWLYDGKTDSIKKAGSYDRRSR